MINLAVRVVWVPSGHVRPCHRHNNVRQSSFSSLPLSCCLVLVSLALFTDNQTKPNQNQNHRSISVVGDRSYGTRHRVFGDSRLLAGVLYQTKTSRKRAGVRSVDAASGGLSVDRQLTHVAIDD